MANRHREVFKIKSSLGKKWSFLSPHYRDENCLHLSAELCELPSGKTLCKVAIKFGHCLLSFT